MIQPKLLPGPVAGAVFCLREDFKDTGKVSPGSRRSHRLQLLPTPHLHRGRMARSPGKPPPSQRPAAKLPLPRRPLGPSGRAAALPSRGNRGTAAGGATLGAPRGEARRGSAAGTSDGTGPPPSCAGSPAWSGHGGRRKAAPRGLAENGGGERGGLSGQGRYPGQPSALPGRDCRPPRRARAAPGPGGFSAPRPAFRPSDRPLRGTYPIPALRHLGDSGGEAAPRLCSRAVQLCSGLASPGVFKGQPRPSLPPSLPAPPLAERPPLPRRGLLTGAAPKKSSRPALRAKGRSAAPKEEKGEKRQPRRPISPRVWPPQDRRSGLETPDASRSRAGERGEGSGILGRSTSGVREGRVLAELGSSRCLLPVLTLPTPSLPWLLQAVATPSGVGGGVSPPLSPAPGRGATAGFLF